MPDSNKNTEISLKDYDVTLLLSNGQALIVTEDEPGKVRVIAAGRFSKGMFIAPRTHNSVQIHAPGREE